MPKIEYIHKDFKASSLRIIQQANEIIEEYQEDGMDLTLRQLYYQFVSRDLIANKQSEYKRLGSIISDARLVGLIDWYAIEDRTRNLRGINYDIDPGTSIRSVARYFHIDHWKNQDYHVEVWIEKEALVGVISNICHDLSVDYFACKGYVSQSEMWRAARRMRRYAREGQKPVIIHLGDHDPSGIDMTRDIEERYVIFEAFDCDVQRIALNMDQIEEFNPPPNPAKLTDSRCRGYIQQYGKESWELDALEPRVMRDLIERTVKYYRDEDVYQETLEEEREYKDILERVADNWKTL